ncbi:endopeptidase [Knoellia sinensis KCTC 19936]|uniref:Endopeptidase n=1 Tax=Knoellia sinensis KCTC 19936 TaxID=1385520 RepID=A0A0A0JBI7_9MICO|nr:L,D-transpeptidase family protein [Knoellia sinensis]KGN34169.1 endopeptidase [Knoellia sinensis KCTC 19936]
MENNNTHEVTRRVTLAGVAGAGLLGLATAGASPAHAATRPSLRKGSTGAHVVALQQRLNALTYWCGTADGNFGHLTQQAVWALQKVAHVSRDGVVGPTTWGLLDRGVKANPRTTSGTIIECDISENVLMLVSGGRLKYTLNTSTANGKRYYSRGSWKTAHTPRGRFSIYWRYTSGWQNGSLGRMWLPAYFKGGYAIHGSTSIPPYPASHGCLRVSTSAMSKLYRESWPIVGRRVYIYD